MLGPLCIKIDVFLKQFCELKGQASGRGYVSRRRAHGQRCVRAWLLLLGVRRYIIWRNTGWIWMAFGGVFWLDGLWLRWIYDDNDEIAHFTVRWKTRASFVYRTKNMTSSASRAISAVAELLAAFFISRALVTCSECRLYSPGVVSVVVVGMLIGVCVGVVALVIVLRCLHSVRRYDVIFTARRSYASAVLGVVILSVCPSHACFVTAMHCGFFDTTRNGNHSSFVTPTVVAALSARLPECQKLKM